MSQVACTLALSSQRGLIAQPRVLASHTFPTTGDHRNGTAAASVEADHAEAFPGELQSPRSGHGEVANFRDDCAKLAVAQAFFETGDDRLLVPRLDVDHPVASLGQELLSK